MRGPWRAVSTTTWNDAYGRTQVSPTPPSAHPECRNGITAPCSLPSVDVPDPNDKLDADPARLDALADELEADGDADLASAVRRAAEALRSERDRLTGAAD